MVSIDLIQVVTNLLE